MMRHGDVAWTTLAVGVTAYEVAAAKRSWELLSTACDRYRDRHPVAANAVIVYLAAHLLRVWPARVDPLHQLAERLAR